MKLFGKETYIGLWKIPTGIGTMYLEGKPSEKELKDLKRKQDERRNSWKPNEESYLIYEQLKSYTGRELIIQIWDKLMTMLYDEGPFPIKIKLKDVCIEKVLYEENIFEQLSLYFSEYEVLKVNYRNCYYDPGKEGNYLSIDENGIFKLNFSDIYSIECGDKFNSIEEISKWRKN